MGVIGKSRRKEQRERNRHARTVTRIAALQGQLAARKAELAAKSQRAVAGLLEVVLLCESPLCEVCRPPLHVGVTPRGVSAVPDGHGETGRGGKG